jgi:hypothetical protein
MATKDEARRYMRSNSEASTSAFEDWQCASVASSAVPYLCLPGGGGRPQTSSLALWHWEQASLRHACKAHRTRGICSDCCAKRLCIMFSSFCGLFGCASAWRAANQMERDSLQNALSWWLEFSSCTAITFGVPVPCVDASSRCGRPECPSELNATLSLCHTPTH